MRKIMLPIFLALNLICMAQRYPSGKLILDKVDNNMSAKTRIMTAKMEIAGARSSRTMVFKSYSEGDHKAFTEYLSPVREKGTKMLKIENQLWIYSPATDRSIQISGHMLRQSVMGSDLSYEDMMNDRALLDQYQAEVTGEEVVDARKCWVLTLNAIVAEINYYKQILWVDQEYFVPLKVDLFAKSGKLLKRTTFSDIQKVQGRWFPKAMVYKDMLKSGEGTKMTIQEIILDANIPANLFNKGSLK